MFRLAMFKAWRGMTRIRCNVAEEIGLVIDANAVQRTRGSLAAAIMHRPRRPVPVPA